MSISDWSSDVCSSDLLVLLAVFADLGASHSPIEQFREHFLAPPVWMEGGSWEFVLGTDAVGRDMLSRLIHGARYSLYVGTIVIVIAFSAGITLGLIRSEEHTSELQSLMRISYAVFCLNKKKN